MTEDELFDEFVMMVKTPFFTQEIMYDYIGPNVEHKLKIERIVRLAKSGIAGDAGVQFLKGYEQGKREAEEYTRELKNREQNYCSCDPRDYDQLKRLMDIGKSRYMDDFIRF